MVLEAQPSLQTAKCGLHQWRSHKTGAWLQEWTTHVCHGLASSAQAWDKGDCQASVESPGPGVRTLGL